MSSGAQIDGLVCCCCIAEFPEKTRGKMCVRLRAYCHNEVSRLQSEQVPQIQLLEHTLPGRLPLLRFQLCKRNVTHTMFMRNVHMQSYSPQIFGAVIIETSALLGIKRSREVAPHSLSFSHFLSSKVFI